MYTQLPRHIASVALLACSSIQIAHATTIEALVQSGQYTQAFAQGKEELVQHEGDPSFDLAFAKAALQTDNLDEALFSLERLTLADPNNIETRLLLAQTLAAMQSRDGALDELAKIKNQMPQQDIEVGKLYAEVHASEPANPLKDTAWVDYSFGYDSNVNFGTYHDTVLGFGNTPIPLSKEATQQSANFNRLGLGGAVQKTLGGGTAVDAILTVGSKSNLGEFYDQTALHFNGGYRFKYRQNNVRTSLRYEKDDVNSEHFRTLNGALLQITGPGSYGWNQGWETTVLTGIASLTYDNATYRDATQYLLGYEGQKKIGNLSHQLRTYYTSERANDNTPSSTREQYTVSWQIEHSNAPALCAHLPASITPYAHANYSYARYAGSPIINGPKRQDEQLNLGLGTRWQYNKDLTLRAEYNYLQNFSNVPSNDLQRNLFEVGLRYAFL